MLEARVLLSTVTVTTSLDELGGDITSIAALIADPGTDRKISLREAILASNNTAGANTITFDPVTSRIPIELTQGWLEITNGVTITGLGAANTTVDGKSLSLIFSIHTTFDDPRAVTLDGLKLTGGKGNDAGAIRSQFAVLTVSNCTIEDNHATAGTFAAGGGINAFNPGVVIINSTISRNSAGGGGIFSQGPVTVINSTISANSALRIGSGGGSGGGISTSNAAVATVTVRNSTISGNSAHVLGGGIHAGGNLTISNSTISGNSANLANTASGGGGISVARSRHLTVINSTISDNSASFGGGIFHGGFTAPATATISNSIVAGNSDKDNLAPDLGGIVASVRVTVTNSLIGDNGITRLTPAPVGAPDGNGNFIGTAVAPINPRLGPLADNGGPTQTRALLPGSPALNAGNDTLAVDAAGMLLPFDQRGPGYARIAGSSVDMGAYEVIPQADLQVTISPVTPNPILEGQEFSYTITVANFGPQTATNVVVAYVDVANGGKKVVFEPGALGNGQQAFFLVSQTAGTAGAYSDTFFAFAEQEDPNPHNDIATVEYQVIAPLADLQVTISPVTPSPILEGQEFSYTISVTNVGPQTATNVVVAYVDVANGGKKVVFEPGTLGNGEQAFFLVKQTAGTAGAYSDTYFAFAKQEDPNPANDIATVEYQVTTPVVNGTAGDDVFLITPTSVMLNGATVFSGAWSALTVNGLDGVDSVTVDDQSTSTDSYYAITDTTVSRAVEAVRQTSFTNTITYVNVEHLAVNAGNARDLIDVQSTAVGTTTLINSGSGIDQVNVLSTRGRLDINNPGGEDTVTVGNLRSSLTIGGDSLSNVQGDVYVSGQGRTFLYVDDSEDAVARNATISYDGTYGTLAGSAAPGLIRWVPSTPSFNSGVIAMDVYAGLGANTFTVNNSGIMEHLYLRTRGAHGAAGQANLLATDSPTFVVGFDTVTVGSLAPALGGTLANIQGPVTIGHAGGPNDALQTSLIVDDSGATTGRTATVTDSMLTGLAPVSIQFTYVSGFPLKSLTIYGGSGKDTFNIQSTAPGTTTLVDTGRGGDVIQVGNNRVLSGINGPLHLQSATTSSGVDLFLDDYAEPAPKPQVVLNDGSVTGLAPATISWTSSATGDGGITGVHILGGSGGNIFTVKNTSLLYHYTYLVPGVGTNQVNVQGMKGNLIVASVHGSVDAVTVGSQAPALGGTLANISGDIYVQGAGSTSLIVDDTGTTTDRIATMTATGLTWQTTAAIHWVPGVVHSVTLNWGSGNDYYFVNSTAAGVTTVINGGEGNDGFGLWSLDEIRGPVALHGEGGSSDNLLLYDYFSPAGNTYTLTTDRVQRLGKADITFDSMIQLILYTSGTGVDIVNIESVAQDVFTPIVLGNGDKITLGRPLPNGTRTLQDIRGTVRPQTYGNGNGAVAVVVDNSGDTNPRQATFTYDPANRPSGHVLSGLTTAPIWFILDATASLLVKGGLGSDSFQLPNVLPPVPLTLDGGGGTNTLDYSAFNTSVLVNLHDGTATAATGRVVNFANVLGGAGDDILIGNDLSNVLTGNGGNDLLLGLGDRDRLYGGAGRDILFGGLGADWLDGGLGDDILNGGYTDYDTQFSNGVAQHAINLAALQAIMREWTDGDSPALSAKDNYKARISHLRSGGGLNGTSLLNKKTVFDDDDIDTLFGGDGLDWFLLNNKQDTSDSTPPESETSI